MVFWICFCLCDLLICLCINTFLWCFEIQADNYRSELDECRNNLTSCLQSQSALERYDFYFPFRCSINHQEKMLLVNNMLSLCAIVSRQIDELQGVVNEQKAEATSALDVKAHENELLRIEVHIL